MDNLTPTITSQLLSMGLPGIVIVGLAYVIYMLYNRMNQMQKEFHAELKELSNENKANSLKMTEVIERNTSASDRHSDLIAKVVERRKRGDGV